MKNECLLLCIYNVSCSKSKSIYTREHVNRLAKQELLINFKFIKSSTALDIRHENFPTIIYLFYPEVLYIVGNLQNKANRVNTSY